MNNILDRIFATRAAIIEADEAREPLAAVRERASRRIGERRPFARALERARGAAIIGEIKRASPSAGTIRAQFSLGDITAAYRSAAVDCLSILTEEAHFGGRLEFLDWVRKRTTTPILRKDFLRTPYEVAQSAAYGADAILLIAGAISDSEIRACLIEARRWNLDALVEVHDAEELRRALRLDVGLIGINNRDLRTFRTDGAVGERLLPLIPFTTLAVAESGIANEQDVSRQGRAGAHAFLIGESLMRSSDVVETVLKFRAAAPPRRTHIKFCGMRSVGDAAAAVRAGADAVGMIFAPSRRRIALQTAEAIVAVLPPHITPVVVCSGHVDGLDALRERAPNLIVQQANADCDAHIQTIRISRDCSPSSLAAKSAHNRAPAILLDTFARNREGGTGRPFPWEYAQELARARRVIVAGGLHARNVGKCIALVRPYGVDVASGIERDGRPDPQRMMFFAEAVRAADAA